MKLLIMIVLLLIGSCAPSSKKSTKKEGLTYWCATNPQELDLAKRLVKEWNESHDVQVALQPIPAGNSSEEVIMAAIAGGTTPDIYSNHWPGMTEELRISGNLTPLDSLRGAEDFLVRRCGKKTLDQFRSFDGRIYQVPWKVNPIMVMYNKKRFRDRGVNNPPVDYEAYLAAAEKLTFDRDGDGYNDHWIGYRDIRPLWYQRWFDFYAFYLAATEGGTLFDNEKKFVLDSTAALKVFSFFKELYERGFFPKTEFQSQPFILSRVLATDICGPWNISTVEYFQADDLEYGFFPIPVPDTAQTKENYTYGDYKNIVVFSSCENPGKAWEFVCHLISRKADAALLETTRQVPVRENLLTDSLYLSFFSQNPEMVPFAEQARYTRCVNSIPEIKEIFDAISQQWEYCCVYHRKTPEEAVRDLKDRVKEILNQF